MSLVFATTFFFFFFWGGRGGGGGVLRHSAVQTDFEFEISGSLPSRVSFHSMTSDPRVHARGGARGHNLEHLLKVGFLC